MRPCRDSWRGKCAPIIAEVLAANVGADEKTIRAALFEAYPFGPRQHHPYKIWLDEIAKQRGKKAPTGSRKLTPKERATQERLQLRLEELKTTRVA